MSKKENEYQARLIKKLEATYPDAIIMKNDSSYIQGIPDLTILEKGNWAALETKREADASKRPNQEYYVNKLNEMSFARFICPENEEEVLHEMEHALHKE